MCNRRRLLKTETCYTSAKKRGAFKAIPPQFLGGEGAMNVNIKWKFLDFVLGNFGEFLSRGKRILWFEYWTTFPTDEE